MTTADALLADVLANPADDTPRLVYADWLDDHGQAERSEFIRVQVELATRPDDPLKMWDVGRHTDTGWAIRKRCELLRRRERELIAHLCFVLASTLPFDAGRCNVCVEPDDRSVLPQCVYRRGFLAEVSCPQQAWLDHGPAIVRQHPVERVTLTDKNPSGSFTTSGTSPQERLCWWKDGHGEPGSRVAPELWEILVPRDRHRWVAGTIPPRSLPWDLITVADYPTEEMAIAALSAACLTLAKKSD